MHAATRHCYYQRATLQLLLRQLRFCAAELAGIRQKQLQIADIGVQYFNRWDIGGAGRVQPCLTLKHITIARSARSNSTGWAGDAMVWGIGATPVGTRSACVPAAS